MDVAVLRQIAGARAASVLVVTSVLVVASCASSPEQAAPQTVSTLAEPESESKSRSESVSESGPDAYAPVRVQVPSIELDEPLIGLGLTEDGAMEVPSDYDDVGWFDGGGRPGVGRAGAVGPTVLAGHVDSTTGPAVFDRLGDVEIGDVITLSTVGGGVASYRVDRVGNYVKEQFPTAEVFGATVDDEIRLITCAGDFDRAVGSYEQNLVVFGTGL